MVASNGQGGLGCGFGRSDEIFDGLDTVVGGFDGLDGLAHFVLSLGQVAGPLGMPLGGEKSDGVVQGRFNREAGTEPTGCFVHEFAGVLQTE